MDSEKSLNLFEIGKKDRLLIEKLFFQEFTVNFSALLVCKVNVLDIFDMSDFCYIAKYCNCDRIKVLVRHVHVIHPHH